MVKSPFEKVSVQKVLAGRMIEEPELQASDIAPRGEEFLTPSQLEKNFPGRIRYWMDNDPPKEKEAKQQAVLAYAKQTGGKVFTGIHSENDWTRTRWWAEGWHHVNRTGEYAVVTPAKATGRLSTKKTHTPSPWR